MSSSDRPRQPRRRPRSGFSATERLHRLVEWLRSGRPLTTPRAAEALGVSRRTITRDLSYLRTALNLNVAFDPSQNSFVLDDEHAALPFLPNPNLAPAFVNAQLPSTLPPDEAALPPVCVRFSARAVQAFATASGQDLGDDTNVDGTLDVHFTPPDLDAFVGWVLSCGCDAEVRKPLDLRKRVLVEIRRMLRVYAEGSGERA